MIAEMIADGTVIKKLLRKFAETFGQACSKPSKWMPVGSRHIQSILISASVLRPVITSRYTGIK